MEQNFIKAGHTKASCKVKSKAVKANAVILTDSVIDKVKKHADDITDLPLFPK